MEAMTFGSAEVENVDDLVADGNVGFEQKYDGTRGLVRIKSTREDTNIEFLGRGGGALKHTAAMQWFAGIREALLPHFPIPGECVLDGEIMIDTGEFIVFDLPYFEVGGTMIVRPEQPFTHRKQMLGSLLELIPHPVRLASTWSSPEAKRDLYDRVVANGGEGIMAKRLDAPYEPGKRVKHSLKVKFVKTADVIVTKSTRGRNEAGRETGAFSLAVMDENQKIIPVGACSAIGKPDAQPGDVIEVAFLYWTGTHLYQPRMRRIREDRAPESCGLDQFTTYSKAVL